MANRYRNIFVIWIFSLALMCRSAYILSKNEAENFAVIIEPVVDLFVNFPLQSNPPVSWSGIIDNQHTCRRAHQILFNDVVQIVGEHDDCVQIMIENVIYGIDEKTKKKLSTYWMDKKSLVPLSSISDKKLLRLFPQPQLLEHMQGHTIILILPWQQFSMATRFVRASSYDDEYAYAVYVFDPRQQRKMMMRIPKSHARVESCTSSEEKRTCFVSVLQGLVDLSARKDHVIPYVWGGCSCSIGYADADKSGDFEQIMIESTIPVPHKGYDCSGLVFACAKAAGLLIPWRNTHMLQLHLEQLQDTDRLQEGDLVWFPGHVMVVSDVDGNELIEARGYASGYGCVHKISVSECFAGITNYEQLRRKIRNGQSLMLLDRSRDIAQAKEIISAKLFKLI